MRTGILLAVLALGGCATAEVENSLAALVGQPIEVAIDRLGPALEQEQQGQDVAYRWNRSTTIRTPVVAPLGTSVNENGGRYSSEHDTVWTRTKYSCDVTLVAGPDGLVKDWRVRDRSGGCRTFDEQPGQLASATAQ